VATLPPIYRRTTGCKRGIPKAWPPCYRYSLPQLTWVKGPGGNCSSWELISCYLTILRSKAHANGIKKLQLFFLEQKMLNTKNNNYLKLDQYCR
jgi:hypothetical protein